VLSQSHGHDVSNPPSSREKLNAHESLESSTPNTVYFPFWLDIIPKWLIFLAHGRSAPLRRNFYFQESQLPVDTTALLFFSCI
jgi:hypothetical protein